MPATSMRYYRDRSDLMLARRLDEFTLIYHRPSGMTHLLDSPMPEILNALSETPRSSDTILKELSRAYDLDGEHGAKIAGLGDHLQMLVSLGLARVTS